MDRWIRHGGRYPLVLLRIWRRGLARIEDRWMDEHMVVLSGRTVTFEGGSRSQPQRPHVLHRQAQQVRDARGHRYFEQAHALFPRDEGVAVARGSAQASWKRGRKNASITGCPFGSGRRAISSGATSSSSAFSTGAKASSITSCRASGIAFSWAPRSRSMTEFYRDLPMLKLVSNCCLN